VARSSDVDKDEGYARWLRESRVRALEVILRSKFRDAETTTASRLKANEPQPETFL